MDIKTVTFKIPIIYIDIKVNMGGERIEASGTMLYVATFEEFVGDIVGVWLGTKWFGPWRVRLSSLDKVFLASGSDIPLQRQEGHKLETRAQLQM